MEHRAAFSTSPGHPGFTISFTCTTNLRKTSHKHTSTISRSYKDYSSIRKSSHVIYVKHKVRIIHLNNYVTRLSSTLNHHDEDVDLPRTSIAGSSHKKQTHLLKICIKLLDLANVIMIFHCKGGCNQVGTRTSKLNRTGISVKVIHQPCACILR